MDSTLLFLLCERLACNVGQSDENVLRCCFFRSSRERAVTPNSAVEEEEEDMVLCIESGLAFDRDPGSKSASSRAVRLPLRGGPPPKLKRLGREPTESEVDMAGEDGESRVLGMTPSVLERCAAEASKGGGRCEEDDGRARSCQVAEALGVRKVELFGSDPYAALVVRAVGVLTMSESAAEDRKGV